MFIASSSKVYGKSPVLPFAKDDDRILGPTLSTRWGYATAKAADEFLGLGHHKENGLPGAVSRVFNVVGPRQTGVYGMVIPRFVNQALTEDPVTVYGDGTQSRCFTHVQDAAQATYELLKSDAAKGEVVNGDTQSQTSINSLAEQVIEMTDSNSQIEHVPFAEVYVDDNQEPDQRKPDLSKLERWSSGGDLQRILGDVIARRRT